MLSFVFCKQCAMIVNLNLSTLEEFFWLGKPIVTSPNEIATLMWWEGLSAPVSLKAIPAGPFEILVGSTNARQVKG